MTWSAAATPALVAVCCLAGGACALDFDRFMPVAPMTDSGAVASAEEGESRDASVDVAAGRRSAQADAGARAGLSCAETEAIMFDGHCYFITATAADWNRSQDECESASGHLVTIASAAEQAAIAALATGQPGQDRWIGLSRPASSPATAGSFLWVSGEAVGYRNWDSGEPGSFGACARVRAGGKWADAMCGISLLAICERD